MFLWTSPAFIFMKPSERTLSPSFGRPHIFLPASSFLQLYSPISYLYKQESAKIPWVDVSLQFRALVNNGFLHFFFLF